MVDTFIAAGLLQGYFDIVRDIINHPDVQRLDEYTQHLGTSRLEHSFHVSVIAWKLAQICGYDERIAARAGLLHDFCLYDFHSGKNHQWQLFVHPFAAAKQSKKLFAISPKEEQAIISHMFPLGPLPLSGEAWFIGLADKICAIAEFINGFVYVFRMLFRARCIPQCQ